MSYTVHQAHSTWVRVRTLFIVSTELVEVKTLLRNEQGKQERNGARKWRINGLRAYFKKGS